MSRSLHLPSSAVAANPSPPTPVQAVALNISGQEPEAAVNFLQGTLDVLILQALAKGPLHGYDVVEWIRNASGGVLEIEEGALYTALHRMEARTWLAADWANSPKGRRAKYYRLTSEGRRQLRQGEREWTRFAGAVTGIFRRGDA